MPSRNVMKEYIEGGVYHVYNRSNRGEKLLQTEKDFLLFLKVIRSYVIKTPDFQQRKNYYNKINILAFCILQNHFHLIIQQLNKTDISDFMQSVTTSFVRRYNLKNKTFGRCFQGVYKARLIRDEIDLIGTSLYVHKNPNTENTKECLIYPYSSIRNYTTDVSFDFVNTNLIKSCLPSSYSYIDILTSGR